MADLDAITALMSLFSDASRVRLMSLLFDEELTVAELTRVTGLTQSRVSTHIGRLREAGLLMDRRVGPATFYRVNESGMPAEAKRMWNVVRQQLDDAILRADRQRCEDIVRARTDASPWPEQVAGRMEHHYSPGRTWEATARGFLGLLHLGDVLDIGSGDGVVASLLAPRARMLTCVDRSPKVLEAAGQRLSHLQNVRLVCGDMHELPLGDTQFDQVLLFNALTYAEQPGQVIEEAFRVLRPEGTLCVVTLDEHDNDEIAAAYQHLNQGFSPDRLRALLETAGFVVDSCEVSSRERRKPYFQVVVASARRPHAVATSHSSHAS